MMANKYFQTKQATGICLKEGDGIDSTLINNLYREPISCRMPVTQQALIMLIQYYNKDSTLKALEV